MLSYSPHFPDMKNHYSEIDNDLITYDLIANLFIRECRNLIRRGLIKDYVTFSEETSSISGKILMTESIPHIVQRRPVVICEKNHYSSNVLLNQIMNTTLNDLLFNSNIKERTRKESFHLLDQLEKVDNIILSREIFNRLRFDKQNSYYKRMVHLARLLFELKLLSHKKGDWSLFSVELSESEMNRLFENFLLNFYRLEQNNYHVQSERMSWNLEGNRAFLPSMQTDITLSHHRENKKIIIDAKFYKNMFQRFYQKDSYHSHNLYQIFAYMMHQPQNKNVRGILIYPANKIEEFSEKYRWDERMKMEIYSLDLDNSPQRIRKRLLDILKEENI